MSTSDISDESESSEEEIPKRVKHKGLHMFQFLNHLINYVEEPELRIYDYKYRRHRQSSESSVNCDQFITARGGPWKELKKKRKTRFEEKLLLSYEKLELCEIETYSRMNRFSQYDSLFSLKEPEDILVYENQDDLYDLYAKIRLQRKDYNFVTRRLKRGKPKCKRCKVDKKCIRCNRRRTMTLKKAHNITRSLKVQKKDGKGQETQKRSKRRRRGGRKRKVR